MNITSILLIIVSVLALVSIVKGFSTKLGVRLLGASVELDSAPVANESSPEKSQHRKKADKGSKKKGR